MKTKSHGCPYLQNKHRCTHVGKCKTCGYLTATDCEFYLEWLELWSETKDKEVGSGITEDTNGK